MRNFIIPGWIWINFILLVAAAIFVRVKLAAAEKTGRRVPESS
ncbi:hypothetical protein [Inquilinus sp. CAU 1745]